MIVTNAASQDSPVLGNVDKPSTVINPWVGIVALAEIILGGFWLTGYLTPIVLLGFHVLAVLLLLRLFQSHLRRCDDLLTPFAVISIIFLGPLGAMGMLLMAVVLHFTHTDSSRLDEWRRRLAGSTERDEVTLLYRTISSGRAHGKGAPAIGRFISIIETGGTAEKQAVLGIVALKYHPDFFPVLKTALKDSEPTIRAQAAAAYTKLRMHFKEQMKVGISEGIETKEKTRIAECIIRLHEAWLSNFLENNEKLITRKKILTLFYRLPVSLRTPEILLIQAEILIAKQSNSEAIDILEPLVDNHNQQAISLFRQVLMAEKRFGELARMEHALNSKQLPVQNIENRNTTL